MKLTFLALLLYAFPVFADEIVFRGVPNLRVISSTKTDDRQVLDGEAASKAECVIVQRGKKYFWQSRNNAPMIRIDKPQFTYFVQSDGQGSVKVFTGERKLANPPADYIENLTNGFEVVTYWGRVP
jgi:hypothetical protein